MRTEKLKTSPALFIAFACAALLILGPLSKTEALEQPKTGAGEPGYILLAPIGSGTTEDCTQQAPDGTTHTVRCTTLSTYLTGMFKVGIGVAGALAFLMIVWGGFTYLSTDAITGKEEGKERIERALGGLVLALASYIILNTINPQLVNLDIYFGEKARVAPNTRPPEDAYTDLISDIGKHARETRISLDEQRNDARDLREAAKFAETDEDYDYYTAGAEKKEKQAANTYAKEIVDQVYKQVDFDLDPKNKVPLTEVERLQQKMVREDFSLGEAEVLATGDKAALKTLQLNNIDKLGDLASRTAAADIAKQNSKVANREMALVDEAAKAAIERANRAGDTAQVQAIKNKASGIIDGIKQQCATATLSCRGYVSTTR